MMRRCFNLTLLLCTLIAVWMGNRGYAEEQPHAAGGAVSSADASHGGEDASHSVGEAAHGGGHAANADPLEVNPDLAIFTLIIFVVLLIVLTKFAWRPIVEALDQREKMVADELETARRNNEESQRLLSEHGKKLDSATEEVRGMLDEARREAEQQKQSILEQAQAAAQSEKERAVREIAAAKNNALEELARSSVDQAVGLAGRIVGKQLNKDDHAQLIQDALQQFPSEN
jgi:F-type H+-transporting ATPase subunit b